MKKFKDYNEIREALDSGKYDVFYTGDGVTYSVRHLGSTIYCKDDDRNLGMGSYTNYNVDGFYANAKPVVESESEEEEEV